MAQNYKLVNDASSPGAFESSCAFFDGHPSDLTADDGSKDSVPAAVERSLAEIRSELRSLQYSVDSLAQIVRTGGTISCKSCVETSKLVRQMAWLRDTVQPLLSRTVHWYLDDFDELKTQYLYNGNAEARSDTYDAYGYTVQMLVLLRMVNGETWFGLYLALCPGPADAEVEWPFCKCYTLAIVHPHDVDRNLQCRIDPRHGGRDTLLNFFRRPLGKPNRAFGCKLMTLQKLEQGGFFEERRLHLSLNVEV